MILEMMINVLAGVGLFVVGLKLFSAAMQQVVGHKLRVAVQQQSKGAISSFSLGNLLGFLLQDVDVITCLIGSLYTTKVIPLKHAIQTLFSCNLGSNILLYVLFFDIKPLIFALFGVGSFIFYLEKPFQWRFVAEAIATFGMMFFAIFFLEENAKNLTEIPGISDWIYQTSKDTPFYFFIIAFFVMITTYSDLPLYIIIAGLSKAHLITSESILLMIYGSSFGYFINLVVLSLGVTAKVRQIFYAQMLFNLCTPVLFLTIFLGEHLLGTHFLVDLFFKNNISPEYQLTNFCVFINAVTVAICYAISAPLASWMSKSPYFIEKKETATSLQFLNSSFALDIEIGSDLICKEVIELTKRIPLYLELRLQAINRLPSVIEENHTIFIDLVKQIEEFIKQISHLKIPSESSSQFFVVQDNFHLITSLEATIYQISTLSIEKPFSESAGNLFSQVLESQHAVLLELLDAMTINTDDEWNVVLTISGLDGQSFQKVRDNFFMRLGDCSEEERNLIFTLTNLMARSAWLIHRFEPLEKKVRDRAKISLIAY